MSPASASRAGATPEASRDTSSGTFANNMRLLLLTLITLTVVGCSKKKPEESKTDYRSPEYLKSIFPGSYVFEKPSLGDFTIETQNKLQKYIGSDVSLAAFRIDIVKDNGDIYIIADSSRYSTRIKATTDQIAFLLQTKPDERPFSYAILFKLRDVRMPAAILTSEVTHHDTEEAFSEIKLDSPYQFIRPRAESNG